MLSWPRGGTLDGCWLNGRPAGPRPRRDHTRRGPRAARRSPAPDPGRPDRPLRPDLPVGHARARDRREGRALPEAARAHALGVPRAREEDLRLRRQDVLLLRAGRPPGDRALAGGLPRHPGAADVGPGRDPDPVRGDRGGGAVAPAYAGCASSRARPTPRSSTCSWTWTSPRASAASRCWTRKGNRSQFTFDRFKENVGLDDALFRFQVPKRGRGRLRMRAAAILLAVALAGCATSSAFRLGEKAERRRDYDQAVLEYSKARQERPRQPALPQGPRAGAPPRVGGARPLRPPASLPRPPQGGAGRVPAGPRPQSRLHHAGPGHRGRRAPPARPRPRRVGAGPQGSGPRAQPPRPGPGAGRERAARASPSATRACARPTSRWAARPG